MRRPIRAKSKSGSFISLPRRKSASLRPASDGDDDDGSGSSNIVAPTPAALSDLLLSARAARGTVVTNDYMDTAVDDATLVVSGTALSALSQAALQRLAADWAAVAAASAPRRGKATTGTITREQLIDLLWEPLVRTRQFDADGSRVAAAAAADSGDLVEDTDGDGGGDGAVRRATNAGLARSVRCESRQRRSGCAPPQEDLDGACGKRPLPSSSRSAATSDLAMYISDLFESIDAQDVHRISWDDFVTFVIERVYFHRITRANDGPRASLLSIRADSHAQSTSAGGSLLYRGNFAFAFPPQTPHWTHQLHYFDNWDAVVALDGPRAVVAMAEDLANGRRTRQSAFLDHRDVVKAEASGSAHAENGAQYFQHEGRVNSCAYLHSVGLFATAASERRQLRLWSVHMRRELRFAAHCAVDVPAGSTITCLRAGDVSSASRQLLCGTRSGHLVALEMPELDGLQRLEDFATSQPLALHGDCVMDMLVLPRSGRVVTCGLDGQIISHVLGDNELRTKSRYVGHQRGVCSLAYCSGYEIFVSGGFEFQALCWAENLPSSPAFPLVDSVQPHQAPVCKVIALENAPHVYTCDLDGVIKLFDVRTLKVLGSWGAFDPGRVPQSVINDVHAGGARGVSRCGSIGAVCYTGSRTRTLLVGAKKLFRYHTETRNMDAERAHEIGEPLVSVAVGPRHILTCTPRSIRPWSWQTGKVVSTHQGVRYRPAPVTVACVDDPSEHIIAGFADGSVCCFAASTGALQRRYHDVHRHPIVAVAVDGQHGVIVSACKLGRVAWWRDHDVATAPTAAAGHMRYVHGALTPIAGHMRRQVPVMRAAEPQLLSAVQHADFDGHVREAALQRWVINRWWRLIARRRGHQDATASESTLSVTQPFATLSLVNPCRLLEVDAGTMRGLVLSGRATCRLVDYAAPRTVLVSHRLYHGQSRQLSAASLMHGRNLVCTADSLGQLFLWLAPPDSPAVILSSWFNKCLVKSYSHPLKEFQERRSSLEEARERDLAELREGIAEKDAEVDDFFAAQEDDGDGEQLDPLEAIPLVTALAMDPHRFMIITGDDVGYVSLWEIETVFAGVCEWRLALKRSVPSGVAPRWIHAWRAHELPVQFVALAPHSMYAVVTAAGDNTVNLWTMCGAWLTGLRQGPIVDRRWPFPDPQRERVSLQLLRYSKLRAAIRSGEALRLGCVAFDAPPPPVSRALLQQLLAYRRGLGSMRTTHGFHHRRSTVADRDGGGVDGPAGAMARLAALAHERRRVSVRIAPSSSRVSSGSALLARRAPSRDGCTAAGSFHFSATNERLRRAHFEPDVGEDAVMARSRSSATLCNSPLANGGSRSNSSDLHVGASAPLPQALRSASQGATVRFDTSFGQLVPEASVDEAGRGGAARFAGTKPTSRDEDSDEGRRAASCPAKPRVRLDRPDATRISPLRERIAEVPRNDTVVLGRHVINETLARAEHVVDAVRKRLIPRDAPEDGARSHNPATSVHDRRDFNEALLAETLGRDRPGASVASERRPLSLRERMALRTTPLPTDPRERHFMQAEQRRAFTPALNARPSAAVITGEVSLGGRNGAMSINARRRAQTPAEAGARTEEPQKSLFARSLSSCDPVRRPLSPNSSLASLRRHIGSGSGSGSRGLLRRALEAVPTVGRGESGARRLPPRPIAPAHHHHHEYSPHVSTPSPGGIGDAESLQVGPGLTDPRRAHTPSSASLAMVHSHSRSSAHPTARVRARTPAAVVASASLTPLDLRMAGSNRPTK